NRKRSGVKPVKVCRLQFHSAYRGKFKASSQKKFFTPPVEGWKAQQTHQGQFRRRSEWQLQGKSP
ncbi:hypothetical protein T12_3516, partial [Trichinella patagoniensis]